MGVVSRLVTSPPAPPVGWLVGIQLYNCSIMRLCIINLNHSRPPDRPQLQHCFYRKELNISNADSAYSSLCLANLSNTHTCQISICFKEESWAKRKHIYKESCTVCLEAQLSLHQSLHSVCGQSPQYYACPPLFGPISAFLVFPDFRCGCISDQKTPSVGQPVSH